MANILTRMKNAAVAKTRGGAEVMAAAGRSPSVDGACAGAVALFGGPIGDIAAGPDTAAVVATHPADHTVSLLDAAGQAVVAAVGVAGAPFAAVVANDRAYITTTSDNSDAIEVVDTVAAAVIASYPLAFSIATLAVSPNGKRVYAGRTADNRVDIAVVDTTAERVGTIDVATGPGIGIDAVRIDPDGRRIHAATTDALGSRLITINAETATVEATMPVGAPIRDLAVGPGGTAFVLTSDRLDGGAIIVVDLDNHKILDTIRVGRAPTQMALSSDGTRAYVVDYNQVAVVSTVTGEVIESHVGARRPSAVAVGGCGDLLYIADYDGGVTTIAVEASTMPLMCSHFIASHSVMADEARELAPA